MKQQVEKTVIKHEMTAAPEKIIEQSSSVGSSRFQIRDGR